MTSIGIDESQRRAANVVGVAYLFAMVASMLAEFYIRGQLIVPGNAAATARNIMEHERLFRVGVATYLMVEVSDVH